MADNRDMNQEDVDQIVRDVFPTQIELGSIADRLIRRGYQKGLQQGYMAQFELGRAAGKIQVLQEWLGDQVSSDRELLGPDLEELQQTINALEERRRQRTSPE